MKILYINNFFTKYGGAEKVFYDEACLFKNKGHQVYFFATNKQPYFEPGYEYSQYFPEYNDYRQQSHIKSLKYINKIYYNKEASYNLKLFLNEIKPDIVHCHNILYYLTPSILKVIYETNIPAVITLHDTRHLCPAGTMLYKNKEYCDKELCIKGNSQYCLLNRCKENSLSKSVLVTTEFKYRKRSGLFDKANIYIVPSDALKQLTIRSGIAEEKIIVINNFADEYLISIKPDYKEGDYFFYAGRIDEIKGIKFMIDTFASLPQIKLIIAGTGKDEAKYRRVIDKKNITNIKFTGYLGKKELSKYFNNAIATILPGYWFENFPMVVVESFAHGKPVIATNVGGVSELVKDSVNGAVIPVQNVSALVDSINKLNTDKQMAVMMGRNARKYLETYLTPDIHYEKLIGVYNNF